MLYLVWTSCSVCNRGLVNVVLVTSCSVYNRVGGECGITCVFVVVV